jgi:hypothetical protein
MILDVYILTKTSLEIGKLQLCPCKNIPVVLVAGERSFLQLEAVPLPDDETP